MVVGEIKLEENIRSKKYMTALVYTVYMYVYGGGKISISSLAKYLIQFRYLHLLYCIYITSDDVFWYNEGYAYDRKKINKQKCQIVKNEIETINIWGCFPFNAMKVIYVTEGTMYRIILKVNLFFLIQQMTLEVESFSNMTTQGKM